jgi:hypothetical protein
MGDIGQPHKRLDLRPLTAPIAEPAPEPAEPAGPACEPVPAGAPA